MSMSCTVFSNRHLVSVGEWQASLRELGFAITLNAEGDHPIATLNGHLPATWNEREAGFECSPGHAEQTAETVEEYTEFELGGPWTCMMDLYFAGYAGWAGAAMAAAAYARQTERQALSILAADEP